PVIDPRLTHGPVSGDQAPRDPEDYLRDVIDLMPFSIVKKFTEAWEGKSVDFALGNYAAGADSFRELAAATVSLEKAILKACNEVGTTLDTINWPALQDSSWPSNVHEITEILTWMKTHLGQSIENATYKVYDYDRAKWIRMKAANFIEARDPEKWLGVIELGLPIVRRVFRNHVGSSKCLSHSGPDAPRGKNAPRYIYPGREQLNGCTCPLETAALELWLSKITRGTEDGKLGMKLAQLLIVEDGLADVSGHTIQTLLQPRAGRLEHTVRWALGQLKDIYSGNSDRLQAVEEAFYKAMENIQNDGKGCEQSDEDDEMDTESA
ncbi:hypothetical protein H0H81_005054, partial [Sphagnurus paluster]